MNKEKLKEQNDFEVYVRYLYDRIIKHKISLHDMVEQIINICRSAIADRDNEIQEYENSLTGVMSLLKNAQERAESYKAVLQELEKYFQIMGGEEIPAEHCIKQLQDLKKKHGVTDESNT
jgi:hypothetical protein